MPEIPEKMIRSSFAAASIAAHSAGVVSRMRWSRSYAARSRLARENSVLIIVRGIAVLPMIPSSTA